MVPSTTHRSLPADVLNCSTPLGSICSFLQVTLSVSLRSKVRTSNLRMTTSSDGPGTLLPSQLDALDHSPPPVPLLEISAALAAGACINAQTTNNQAVARLAARLW